jgi:hypothetical protein
MRRGGGTQKNNEMIACDVMVGSLMFWIHSIYLPVSIMQASWERYWWKKDLSLTVIVKQL